MTQSPVYPGFRWFVMFAVLFSTAASTAVMIAPSPLIGIAAKSLGLTPGAATGTIMGLWNIFTASSCLLTGFLIDRLGFIKVVVGGTLLMIVPALFYTAVGNHLPAVLALRVLQAIGAGPTTASIGVLAATWFPPHQRSFVAGLYGIATCSGVAVGFMTSPSVYAATHSWLAAMSWMALAPTIALAFILAVPFGPQPPAISHTESEHPEAENDFRLSLKISVTWILCATAFVSCWFFTGFNDLTPGYFAIDPPTGIGYGPLVAGRLMTLYQAALIVGSLLIGYLFNIVLKENPRLTVTIAFLVIGISAPLIMLHGIYASVTFLTLVLLVIGFFSAWVMPTCITFIALQYPTHIVGRVTGLLMGFALFAGIPGIIVGATALHATHNYHMSIIIVSTAAISGAIIAQFIKPIKRLIG